MLASHTLYHFSYVSVVFSGMLLKYSLLLCLQPVVEQKLNTAQQYSSAPR